MDELEAVRASVASWRANRRGKAGRFPDSLKCRVVSLLAMRTAPDVAKALKVTPAQLKDWQSRFGQGAAMHEARALPDGGLSFIELPAAVPPEPMDVELQLGQAVRLRFRGKIDLPILKEVMHVALEAQRERP